jgi:hypothetical protein
LTTAGYIIPENLKNILAAMTLMSSALKEKDYQL